MALPSRQQPNSAAVQSSTLDTLARRAPNCPLFTMLSRVSRVSRVDTQTLFFPEISVSALFERAVPDNT
jgi:hypothetical protein